MKTLSCSSTVCTVSALSLACKLKTIFGMAEHFGQIQVPLGLSQTGYLYVHSYSNIEYCMNKVMEL